MKYKLLSKEQLIISFDRLTRFKLTKDKYYRVFSDIITSNLIEPVYKKQDLINMPANEITKMAVNIINASLKNLTLSTNLAQDNVLNTIIKECENTVFNNNKDTQDFLNNDINYNLLVSLIDESCPINLRWVKAIHNAKFSTFDYKSINDLRQEKGLKFPIRKVLLVEGITEEILLPEFSRYLGFDFFKAGIQIIPAGGKNQVVKSYYKLIEELNIPIFVLLDKDAEENIKQIKPKLRDIDRIHLVSCGEFEDLLPQSLIIKTINNELNNFATIAEEDFDSSLSKVKNLINIFKLKGLHEFKKADFAKLIKDNISNDSDISEEIKTIINELNY